MTPYRTCFPSYKSQFIIVSDIYTYTYISLALSLSLPPSLSPSLPLSLYILGFTPCKAEQLLQGMELQEKEAQKN